MNEPLRLAYESARDRMAGVTFEQFATEVADFDVHPVKARGLLCGAVLVRGNEMHPCVMPWARGYWFGRSEAALLNHIIELYGEATTVVTTEDGKCFVDRLGFINDNGIYRSTRKWELKRSSAK